MSGLLETTFNTILAEDCIAGLQSLPAGCADLVFADPPFNIGYDYDVYQDQIAKDQYLSWSRDWMSAVYQVLKPDGTFWLAIGDEYAAELKVAAQEIGFFPRSWVIWYYTFGVNCKAKFSRSHAHLFYFVKDQKKFTFLEENLENRIPSARQLVYNDKRANPRGRLPDDTWIISPSNLEASVAKQLKTFSQLPLESTWTLRPQDVEACFQPDEDTWYFPRVAGTFKERAGFHGCQMPEQLLGRIIRSCSLPDELVIDPFSGSATTLAVAKKLGRNYLGYDLSLEYVKHGLNRLQDIRRGDRLEGAAEPLMSAPKTGEDKNIKKKKASKQPSLPGWSDSSANDQQQVENQLELTLRGIAQAFLKTHDGFCLDRMLADPLLNKAFVDCCREMGLAGDALSWNLLLSRLQKAGLLPPAAQLRTTEFNESELEACLPASEMAMQILLDQEQADRLEELLCDPALAARFDQLAAALLPGHTPLVYRWRALELCKQADNARGRGYVLWNAQQKVLNRLLSQPVLLTELSLDVLPESSGLYLLQTEQQVLYAGAAENLRQRLSAHQQADPAQKWLPLEQLQVRYRERDIAEAGPLSWQCCLVAQFQPELNYRQLRTV